MFNNVVFTAAFNGHDYDFEMAVYLVVVKTEKKNCLGT